MQITIPRVYNNNLAIEDFEIFLSWLDYCYGRYANGCSISECYRTAEESIRFYWRDRPTWEVEAFIKILRLNGLMIDAIKEWDRSEIREVSGDSLVPGKTYEVKLIDVGGRKLDECIKIMQSAGAVMVGVRGLLLIWQLMRDNNTVFPLGEKIISLTYKEKLERGYRTRYFCREGIDMGMKIWAFTSLFFRENDTMGKDTSMLYFVPEWR